MVYELSLLFTRLLIAGRLAIPVRWPHDGRAFLLRCWATSREWKCHGTVCGYVSRASGMITYAYPSSVVQTTALSAS